MRVRGFEIVPISYLRSHEEFEPVMLPIRGSKKSAGYDFFCTEKLIIKPNEQKFFWTDIRAYMKEDEVLELYIRSSLAIKKNIILSNIVGIIDSDYYDNEDTMGNIGIALKNIGIETIEFNKGDRVVQGIFKKFLISDNCNSVISRMGGFGSTNIVMVNYC